MNKKLLIGCTLATFMLGALGGCGKTEETTETVAVDSSISTQAVGISLSHNSMINENIDNIALVKDGMILNDLNGEWVDASLANKRYIAVMINNLIDAMPQSGVEQADIVYEFLVEGGITRLMAVYSDYSNLDKIGPVRSARHYYDRKAMEFDAVYVHVGQSYLAQADFDSYADLDDINGLSEAGFYRDNSRVAPHNCYTSTSGIEQQIEANGFDTVKSSSYKKMFDFNKEDTDLADGNPAYKVVTAFHTGRKPWFEYDETSKTYKRFQYGEAQIDDTTGNQLSYKNVIIQYAPHNSIPGEDKLIDIVLTGEGDGLYMTNGKMIPITWKKTADNSVTHYYTSDGKELKLNPGKTWITYFDDDMKGDQGDGTGIIVSSAEAETAE